MVSEPNLGLFCSSWRALCGFGSKAGTPFSYSSSQLPGT